MKKVKSLIFWVFCPFIFPLYGALRRIECWFCGVPRIRVVAMIEDKEEGHIMFVRHTGHRKRGLPGGDLRPGMMSSPFKQLCKELHQELGIKGFEIYQDFKIPSPCSSWLEYDELWVYHVGYSNAEQCLVLNHEITEFSWVDVLSVDLDIAVDAYAKACIKKIF